MSPKIMNNLLFDLRREVSFITPLKYREVVCSSISLYCTCQDLEQFDSVKYLGLHVDSKLILDKSLSSTKNQIGQI